MRNFNCILIYSNFWSHFGYYRRCYRHYAYWCICCNIYVGAGVGVRVHQRCSFKYIRGCWKVLSNKKWIQKLLMCSHFGKWVCRKNFSASFRIYTHICECAGRSVRVRIDIYFWVYAIKISSFNLKLYIRYSCQNSPQLRLLVKLDRFI